MLTPRTSGLLTGGGLRHFKVRRSAIRNATTRNQFPELMLSQVSAIKRDIPDFDPALEHLYTPRELTLLAEKILLTDPKPCTESPMWLNARMYLKRSCREIYTKAGSPDPSIVSGLYWRTHPDGRGVHTLAQRKDNHASYYKMGQGNLENGDGRLERSLTH